MKWTRSGWGKNYSSEFDEKSRTYYVDYSNIVIPNKPLREVANSCIEQISKEYPAPYYLLASGGVDSQSMIWCWMNSGVPFTVVSFKYIHDGVVYNDHDLETLEQFSSIHEIPVQYLEFDPINFNETELISYATKYYCTSPQICTHMKISEQLTNGTVIFSGNFGMQAMYSCTIFGLKRYADISGRSVIPFFFLHDAELAGALNHLSSNPREIYKSDEELRQTSPYMNKVLSIQKLGIPVIPQSQKFNGFEKIKEYYDLQQDRVTEVDRKRFSKKPSKRVYDILFRYRLTDLVKYNDQIMFKTRTTPHK